MNIWLIFDKSFAVVIYRMPAYLRDIIHERRTLCF